MDAVEMCEMCGARMAPGIDWCLRCYAPRERTPREDDLPSHVRLRFPSEGPTPPPVYSRWRGGTTTFGPVGRIAITLFIVFAHASLWFLLGANGIVFIGIGYIALTALSVWILTHVWRRDRVG